MSDAFSPKDPDEVILLSWDFSPRLLAGEVIVSATWVIQRQDGATEDTSTMLQGAVDLASKPIVRQVVKGGKTGVTYIHRITATTSDDQVLIEKPTQQVLR
jgi:hypothetical protein